MSEVFAPGSAADASGTPCGGGWAAIAAVASLEVSELSAAVIAARLGFRSGNGTTAGFATLVTGLAVLTLFATTGLARDFVACVLAASGPGARTGGTNNAQSTMRDTVVLKRFILVDRSGFAIPPLNGEDFPLSRGSATKALY